MDLTPLDFGLEILDALDFGIQISESSVGFQDFQDSQQQFWTFRIFSVGLQDFDPLGLWASEVP
jgi:hypothetical protein